MSNQNQKCGNPGPGELFCEREAGHERQCGARSVDAWLGVETWDGPGCVTIEAKDWNKAKAAFRSATSGRELLNMAFETYFRNTPAKTWNDDETRLVLRSNQDRVERAAIVMLGDFVNHIQLPALDIAKALDADGQPSDDPGFEPWNRAKY